MEFSYFGIIESYLTVCLPEVLATWISFLNIPTHVGIFVSSVSVAIYKEILHSLMTFNNMVKRVFPSKYLPVTILSLLCKSLCLNCTYIQIDILALLFSTCSATADKTHNQTDPRKQIRQE